MRAILFLLVCLSLPAYGQSTLPPCDSNVAATSWTNCQGTHSRRDFYGTGNKYVGEFRDGKAHGQGTYTWATGSKYVGEFRDDKFNGQGTYTYAPGDKYVGEFRDDRPNGQGIFTYADGRPPEEGVFEDGKFVRAERIPDHIAGRAPEKKPPVAASDNGIATNTAQVGKITPSTPQAGNLKSQVPDERRVAQAAAKEAELTAARLENERLRQQLQSSQAQPSIDKTSTNAVVQTSKPSDSKISAVVKRHALIIGNNDYRNVPKLDNAVGDSKAISSLLGKLGYEVLTLNDLNEKQFKGALRQFNQRLEGGEEVVFFFAGHGVQIGSENYLLPTDVGSDSEGQIRDEGIPLQRVLNDFSESKVKFSLAMVDACRDNPFKSTGRSIGGRGLAATSAATGQMVIFSAGVGQQALDRLGTNDKARNGLFTRVLIDKVSQSKEPIHILMRDVRAEVAKLAQSVGHDQVPAIYDQVIGDFYFVPKK